MGDTELFPSATLNKNLRKRHDFQGPSLPNTMVFKEEDYAKIARPILEAVQNMELAKARVAFPDHVVAAGEFHIQAEQLLSRATESDELGKQDIAAARERLDKYSTTMPSDSDKWKCGRCVQRQLDFFCRIGNHKIGRQLDDAWWQQGI